MDKIVRENLSVVYTALFPSNIRSVVTYNGNLYMHFDMYKTKNHKFKNQRLGAILITLLNQVTYIIARRLFNDNFLEANISKQEDVTKTKLKVPLEIDDFLFGEKVEVLYKETSTFLLQSRWSHFQGLEDFQEKYKAVYEEAKLNPEAKAYSLKPTKGDIVGLGDSKRMFVKLDYNNFSQFIVTKRKRK